MILGDKEELIYDGRCLQGEKWIIGYLFSPYPSHVFISNRRVVIEPNEPIEEQDRLAIRISRRVLQAQFPSSRFTSVLFPYEIELPLSSIVDVKPKRCLFVSDDVVLIHTLRESETVVLSMLGHPNRLERNNFVKCLQRVMAN